MQAYFRERANFDQASAILDSTSEEAWGETKKRPTHFSQANMAANLRSRARIYDRELQYENACTAGYVERE